MYTYGTHSNDTLLAEYGFVLDSDAGNKDDSIEVTRYFAKLLQRLDTKEAESKEVILKNLQYWG